MKSLSVKKKKKSLWVKRLLGKSLWVKSLEVGEKVDGGKFAVKSLWVMSVGEKATGEKSLGEKCGGV